MTRHLLPLLVSAMLGSTACHGAFLIGGGKLTTDLNANTNKITNATDFVTASGVSLTNLSGTAGSGATGVVVNAFITNASYNSTTRQFTLQGTGGGGGSGNVTNISIGGVNNTGNVIIAVESNIVTRADGGTNYIGLSGTIANAITFSGSINANDNIEIANTKHLRFQDGGGTNTVHLAATAGRLAISGAVDIINGHAVPFTVNGVAPLYTSAWATADSTTNYVARTGGSFLANSWSFGTLVGNPTYLIANSTLAALDSDGGAVVAYQAGGVLLVGPTTNLGTLSSASGFIGPGSGLTDIPLTGLLITNTPNAGDVLATSNGTNGYWTTPASGGGSLANQRSFEWRDAEGSLNVGWNKQLAPGINLVSVRTATNDLTFAAYATTASTTLQTNTLYVMFEHPVTGSIPWAVRSSQAVTGGLVIFTPKDGQTAGAAITQTFAAASTTYVTNQPLSITARTATIEVRIATTNAANLFQLGVDVQ